MQNGTDTIEEMAGGRSDIVQGRLELQVGPKRGRDFVEEIGLPEAILQGCLRPLRLLAQIAGEEGGHEQEGRSEHKGSIKESMRYLLQRVQSDKDQYSGQCWTITVAHGGGDR